MSRGTISSRSCQLRGVSWQPLQSQQHAFGQTSQLWITSSSPKHLRRELPSQPRRSRVSVAQSSERNLALEVEDEADRPSTSSPSASPKPLWPGVQQAQQPAPPPQRTYLNPPLLDTRSPVLAEDRRTLPTSVDQSTVAGRAAAAASKQERQRRRWQKQKVKYYEELIKVWLGHRSAVWRHEKRHQPPLDLAEITDVDELLSHFELAVEARNLPLAVDVTRRICDLEDLAAARRITHKGFLAAAATKGAVAEALAFVEALPKEVLSEKTFSLLVSVCTAAADLRAALRAAEMAEAAGVRLDAIHYTNLINVCGHAGNLERAIKLYNELKLSKRGVDMHVYSSLINAFRLAIERLPSSQARKQQLVLLERAFTVLDDGLARGINLTAAVWDSLLACTASCSQLERALQVVDMMQVHGTKPTAQTYTCLVLASVRAGQQQLALQLFKRGLKEGHTGHLQLYTVAILSCMMRATVSSQELQLAMDIFRLSRQNGVTPDDVLYGHLIALTGRARRIDMSFELLKESLDAGLTPTRATCSALISTCLRNTNHYAAMLVYRLLVKHGVYPSLQQYNNLIYAYSLERRLGEVVSLVRDMVLGAKLQPNKHTFSRLLDACDKLDQAELAFELLTVMKSRGMNITLVHFWHVVKICFNRIRCQWYPPTTPPGAPIHGRPTPATSPHTDAPPPYTPTIRHAEAVSLLEVLGSPTRRRAGSFLEASESVNWATRALAVYRDAVSSGMRPSLHSLDRLVACLRWQHRGSAPQDDAPLVASALGAASMPSSMFLPQMPGPLQGRERQRYELPFDKRIFAIVEEAMSRNLLPPFSLTGPTVLDLRHMRPSLAEAYLHFIFFNLEKRGASMERPMLHTIQLLVQPFDPNMTMWPTYVEKLNRWEYTGEPLDAGPRGGAGAGGREGAEEEGLGGEEAGEEGEEEAEGVGGRREGGLRAALGEVEEEEEQTAMGGRTLAGGVALRSLEEELQEEEEPAPSGPSIDQQRELDIYGPRPNMAALLQEDVQRKQQQQQQQDAQQAAAAAAAQEGEAQGWRKPETGLAVAATLKRLRLQHVRMDAVRGVIVLDPRDLNDWITQKARYDQQMRKQEEAEAISAMAPPPSSRLPPPGRLQDQQRNIRLGMGPNMQPRRPSPL